MRYSRLKSDITKEKHSSNRRRRSLRSPGGSIMVCYWSISARLPYTFLLPFVLRPATFVHAEDVGWYTRIREERGAVGERRARQSHAGIPRTPRTARIPEAPREKAPLSFFFLFFFLSRSREKFLQEREREGVEPLWNISWSQSSIQRKERFFLWLKFNLFRWQMLLYPNIFSYFAIKVVA